MIGRGGAEQLGEDRLVTLPALLQGFDLIIEPRQRDIVVKIEPVGDLPIDVLVCIGDVVIAFLAGVRDPLTQFVEFCRIVSPFGDRQQQSADVSRLFDRADVGLGERDVGRKIVLVDNGELVVDRACHLHAHQRDRRHQDQQSDSDAKDLQPDGKPHGAASERQETGPQDRPRRCAEIYSREGLPYDE